jgi:hypothetical protein
MRKPERQTNDAEQTDATPEGDVGDVETAGETTAAATISGPSHDKPVGADTMAQVGGASDQANDPE